jgi:CelD/BcsL family acetyltransferase involved in cellulose biosynthesis
MPVRQDILDGHPAAIGAGHAGADLPSIDIVSGPAAAATLHMWSEARPGARRPGNAFHHDGLLRAALDTAGNHAAIAVVKRNDQIATVWPLRFEHRYGIRLATDLAAPFAQYSDVIGEALDRRLFHLLRGRLRDEVGVDAILCRGVRRDSGLAGALPASSIVEESAAPYVDLDAFGSFADYCASYGKKTTRNRRQRRRKLETRHGPLGFAVLNGRQGREAVERALHWKREWLGTHGLSSRVIDASDRQAVLLAAIDDPASHVSVLSAQGAPIAVELGFSCAGSYAAFMGAFDPDYAAYSPGQEQMLLTIEWCFAQGFSRYDLLPPRDAYKLSWTREQDEVTVTDHCIPLSSVGALYAWARRYARTPIKRAVMSMPASLRVAAKRYGPAAAGVGATAATIGILAD